MKGKTGIGLIVEGRNVVGGGGIIDIPVGDGEVKTADKAPEELEEKLIPGSSER